MKSALERYGKPSKRGLSVTIYARNFAEACEILYDCAEVLEIGKNTYKGYEV